MPKKRQVKALLIKPGSHSTSGGPSFRQNESSPSVNDLIRESRKLQLRNEPASSNPLTASVPPHLRDVLNLPPPQPPAPRAGVRVSGPLRQRRIPGPPPPRSWLVDSRHAPSSEPSISYQGHRIQINNSRLPGDTFPRERSLLHMLLKELAVNWEWHAEYDGIYLATLPTYIKQSLLSYISVYSDGVRTNPLRLLFLVEDDVESQKEITRLDLTAAVGMWATTKQLTKDLTNRDIGYSTQNGDSAISNAFVPTSWDDEEEQRLAIAPSVSSSGMAFKNLRHLSLALSPGSSASWQGLIRLATGISTITSLSLAYWPQPTYTPRAAATRAVFRPASNMPSVVYGGSNVYSAMDNDWREAAGILRSLSRTLYCLKWLDLTGCGEWFEALMWQPNGGTAGPEWNGSWRSIDRLCLGVGWKPVPLSANEGESDFDEVVGWDVQLERQKHYHRKELERHETISRSAAAVVQYLHGIRKGAGGKWIEFD